MRKLLALAIVVAMTSTSFAYLPVSRWANWNNLTPAAYTIPASGQTNIGSYQNSASQGMFFGELDIISANPVELLDFEGNNLYTQWSNLRNAAASNATYPTALSWGNNANNANLSPLQIGVSGNPLGMFGIEGSRAGVVFQNYGAKAAVQDLDNAAGNDCQYYNYTEQNLFVAATSTRSASPDQVWTGLTDMKSYTNTTNTQWNVGLAKKDLFLSGLSMGFGLAHTGKNVVLNAGGTQTYEERYLTDLGAPAGIPTATRGDIYTASYTSDQPEQDSEYSTDLVFQGRYGLMDNLSVQGALGARFATFINPGGLIDAAGAAQGVLQADAMTLSVSDDQNNLANTSGVLTQYYDLLTSIVSSNQNRAGAVSTGLLNSPTIGNLGAAALVDYVPANAAITSVSDKRTGMGPMIEVQGTYSGIEKVNVTGVLHYDTLKQPIGAEVNKRMYVKENDVVSNAQTTEFVQDYQESVKSDGENSISNLDLGGKIEFKAMENLKLNMGAFIRSNTNLSDFSKITITQNQTISYQDGVAGDIPGTVNTTNKPGPGNDRFGADAGNGEGVWTLQNIVEASGQTKVESVSYVIPFGMEIPVYKDKWIFRAGTAYTMTKTKQTVSTGGKRSISVTNATAAGATAAVPVYAETQDNSTVETVTYGETHTTSYTYGIQWNMNQNLTLAMNAFLDTNANSAAGGASAVKATIFDLDNLRNLSLQAVFHF